MLGVKEATRQGQVWLNQDTKGPPGHMPLFPATQWVEEGGWLDPLLTRNSKPAETWKETHIKNVLCRRVVAVRIRSDQRKDVREINIGRKISKGLV